MRKSIVLFPLLIVALLGGVAALTWWRLSPPPPSSAPVPYTVDDAFALEVELVEGGAGSVTRLKFTPDGDTLLVANLTGEVWAYARDGAGDFVRQKAPAFKVDLNLPAGEGPIPRANGLTGLILAADFPTSGEIFLTHIARGEDNRLRNLITRVKLQRQGSQVTLTEAKVIFAGNVAPVHSHQIQGGVGLMLNGRSHVLFTIGDATQATLAPNPKLEAGKLMLIDRFGAAPTGPRPFPEQPRVQAVGLRNPYDLTVDVDDPRGRILIPDTGPEGADRLLYGNFDQADEARDFGWRGDTEALRRHPSVIHAWSTPVTPADVRFVRQAGGGLPVSTAAERTFVLVQWGSYDGAAPRGLLFGRLSEQDGKTKVALQDLVRFHPDANVTAEGQPGAPLGMDLDPKTGTVYFGDVMAGRLYRLVPRRR